MKDSLFVKLLLNDKQLKLAKLLALGVELGMSALSPFLNMIRCLSNSS